MSPFEQQRRIGLHHITFFRASFETTLDLQDLADRYLETGRDLAAARRTLKMIQTAFIKVALRQGKHGEARLLRLPRGTLTTKADVAQSEGMDLSAANIPTLDEYIAIRDPDQFFSESEMLEMYQDEYGTNVPGAQGFSPTPPSNLTPSEIRRLERNERLIQRRTAVINRLAAELTVNPGADDLVEGWFDYRVARRLKEANLLTLGDIIDYANYRGYRWYATIPKFGKVTASKIINWLEENEIYIGKRLSAYATTPRSQIHGNPFTGHQPPIPTAISRDIVPLERFASPIGLDGAAGRNRASPERNKIDGAENDLQAIHAWLALYKRHTRRSYEKEAERLLLWSIVEKQKPFSSLTTNDVSEFVAFLEDPQPAHKWVAPRRYERGHPAWRPFVAVSEKSLTRNAKRRKKEAGTFITLTAEEKSLRGGLSPESVKHSITVLKNLCGWLVEQRYLDSNPFSGLPTYVARQGIRVDRSLSKSQWNFVKEYISKLDPNDLDVARLRFMLKLAYGTGMRLSEMANAVIGDIKRIEIDERPAWTIEILGKRSVTRVIPFGPVVMKELQAYLVVRGLPPALSHLPKSTPLIAKLPTPNTKNVDDEGFVVEEALTESAIYKIFRTFFQSVGDAFTGDPDSKANFHEASTHWLRHTFGSHAIADGVSLDTVREILGHTSLETTSIYVHAERDRQHREAAKFLDGQDF